MDLGLQDKVAMVAAASKGLGYGMAESLAREGARVSIASRTRADIQGAAQRIREATDAEVLATVFDATDAQSIVNWCKATSEGFGGVDCLVVNAGGPPRGVFDHFDDSDWIASFELTILSAVRMIRAVLPSMRRRGGGSILTITSATVKEPADMLLMSNVMRSGVTSLAKSLSRQLASEKIRVNNLVPGRIDTGRSRSLDTMIAANKGISLEAQKTAQRNSIPLGRYGTIEEFGKVGAFLLSDAASYINGATVLVDGGKTKTVW